MRAQVNRPRPTDGDHGLPHVIARLQHERTASVSGQALERSTPVVCRWEVRASPLAIMRHRLDWLARWLAPQDQP
jgi:hypothetical protein